MKSEDIIEALNSHIEYRRKALDIEASGHLVLQKIIQPHQSFKAYKEYDFIVWFVKKRSKYKVLTIKHIARVLDGQEDSVIRMINIELGRLLFDLIGSELHEQMIKGEYGGNSNE